MALADDEARVVVDVVLQPIRRAVRRQHGADQEHGIEVGGLSQQLRLFRVVEVDLGGLDDLKSWFARNSRIA